MRREPDYQALADRACRNAKPLSDETVEYLASIFGPARLARLNAEADQTVPASEVEAA